MTGLFMTIIKLERIWKELSHTCLDESVSIASVHAESRRAHLPNASLDLYDCATQFLFHWLYSPLRPWPVIFSFMIILQTVGLLG
jgi:hypothetical protein